MFCKLIVCANRWIKESTWKDLALVKLCLCALGAILGLTALRRSRKVSLVLSIVVFLATWLPLMQRFAGVVRSVLRAGDEEAPEAEEAAGEEPLPASDYSSPAQEDFSCDLDLA